MSGDVSPERLDAILDGRAQAETDLEREMLALAARMQSEEPRADQLLRTRVRAIATRPGRAGRVRQLGRSWRGRALIAGPAVAVAVAVVVAVGVFGDGGGPSAGQDLALRDGATQTTAATEQFDAAKSGLKQPEGDTAGGALQAVPPAAASRGGADAVSPEAPGATLRVAAGTRDARLADIRRIVSGAGGRVDAAPLAGTGSLLLTITLPPDSAAGAIDAVAALAEGTPPPIAVDPVGVARVVLEDG